MVSLKRIFPAIFFAAAILILPNGASGRETSPACDIPFLKTALVAKVHRNGILQLASGEMVRLISVMPVKFLDNPSRPFTRKLNALAKQAVDLLRREVEGKSVRLHQSGRSHDRYDRLLAQVYAPSGQWLQGVLLQEGLARSFSYRDNRACMKEMLALETKARTGKRGLWRYHLFQPHAALADKKLLRKRFSFTLVEGRVRKVASVKKWVFLNFGDNWRDDFTIAIKRKYKKKIERSGLNLESLQGRRVRVRGWIEHWNGPMIKVTHKEQIEVLGEK